MNGQSYRSVPGQQVPFRWMSPEALERRRFSQASDVWAFGVTAWEMLTDGAMPFAFIADDAVVAERVCGGMRLPRPVGGSDPCSDEMWGVLLSCWEAEPRDRLTFADVAGRLAEIEATMAGGQRQVRTRSCWGAGPRELGLPCWCWGAGPDRPVGVGGLVPGSWDCPVGFGGQTPGTDRASPI